MTFPHLESEATFDVDLFLGFILRQMAYGNKIYFPGSNVYSTLMVL